MSILEKLDKHFNSSLESEILKHFKVSPTWHYMPLDDSRDYFWMADKYTVYFSNEIFELAEDSVYSNEIIGKFYEDDEFIIIPVDTRCDGNKFLSVFSLANKLPYKGF